MPVVVIDASAALSAVLTDEGTAAAGEELISDFISHDIELVAPALWSYEVTQGLRKAVAQERMSVEVGSRSARFLLGLGVLLVEYTALADRTWSIALDYRLSIYDACYVALAERERCYCLTADKDLIRATTSTGLVRWIGDYGR